MVSYPSDVILLCVILELLHEAVHGQHATSKCWLGRLGVLVEGVVVVHEDGHELLDDGLQHKAVGAIEASFALCLEPINLLIEVLTEIIDDDFEELYVDNCSDG